MRHHALYFLLCQIDNVCVVHVISSNDENQLNVRKAPATAAKAVSSIYNKVTRAQIHGRLTNVYVEGDDLFGKKFKMRNAALTTIDFEIKFYFSE